MATQEIARGLRITRPQYGNMRNNQGLRITRPWYGDISAWGPRVCASHGRGEEKKAMRYRI